MSFALYALLGPAAPIVTNESLASDLARHFAGQEAFSVQFERLPFAAARTLALRWDRWLVRVAFEEGQDVVADSQALCKMLGVSAPPALTQVARRIRVVFGDDPDRRYTNQIVYVMEFLAGIPDTTVIDPQQKDIVGEPRA